MSVQEQTDLDLVGEVLALMAQHKEPSMLCRALAHCSLFAGNGVMVTGIQLVVVADQGRLEEIGFFGARPGLAVTNEHSTGDSLIAESFRQKLMTITALSPEGPRVAIVPLLASYPVGALVVTYLSDGVDPDITEPQLQVLGSAAALYLSDFAGGQQRPRASANPAPLTPRQLEVLTMLAQGLTNQQIAERTGTSHSNIRQTTVTLYSKLGATGRQDAVKRALGMGIL